MTNEEKILVQLLKKLNQDQETVIAIILSLGEKKNGANIMIDYLKNINSRQITTQQILDKTLEIVNN